MNKKVWYLMSNALEHQTKQKLTNQITGSHCSGGAEGKELSSQSRSTSNLEQF